MRFPSGSNTIRIEERLKGDKQDNGTRAGADALHKLIQLVFDREEGRQKNFRHLFSNR